MTAGTASRRHVPGEPGVWVLILGDMCVFAVLFGVFVYYQAEQPDLFESSQALLTRGYGAANTLVLLTSSLLVVTAVRSLRSRDRRHLASPLFAGAFACGLVFAGIKVLEYSAKLDDGLKPATDDFWMLFYVLTGLHLFHLLVGMAVLAFLFTQARRAELSAQRFAFVEGGACFWHMVDLLWIVLFPLLYLAH